MEHVIKDLSSEDMMSEGVKAISSESVKTVSPEGVKAVASESTKAISPGGMNNIYSAMELLVDSVKCCMCSMSMLTQVQLDCGHSICKSCAEGYTTFKIPLQCPVCKVVSRDFKCMLERKSVVETAEKLANACQELFMHSYSTSWDDAIKSSTMKTSTKSDESERILEKESNDGICRKRKSIETENKGVVRDSNKKLSKKSEKNAQNIFMKSVAKSRESETVPEKKPKSSDDKIKDLSCRKRKSDVIENEDMNLMNVDESASKMGSAMKEDKNLSLNKRPFSDSDSLPSIEEIFKLSQVESREKPVNVACSSKPTMETTGLKTYSKCNTLQKESCVDPFDFIGEDTSGLDLSYHKLLDPTSNKQVQKPLKGKEIGCEDKQLMKIDSRMKKNKMSPVIKRKISCGKKKSKCSMLKNASNTNTGNVINKSSDTEKKQNAVASRSEGAQPSKQHKEKVAEDPFKSLGLTDTAISVDAVASPLAASKISSLQKSPGWSHFNEVKRQFKMKKFKSLHVEKNSPKNTSIPTNPDVIKCTGSSASLSDDNAKKNATMRELRQIVKNTTEPQQINQPSCVEKLSVHKKVNSEISKGDSIEMLKYVEESRKEVDDVEAQQMTEPSCVEKLSVHKEVNSEISKGAGIEILRHVEKSNKEVDDVPSLNINSKVCSKYLEIPNSQEMTVKSFQEVSNISLVNNENLVIQNKNVESLEKLILSDGNEISGSEFNQNSMPLYAPEFQNLYDGNLHYVEQSQQTSQAFDFHGDNLKDMKIPYFNLHEPKTEKTKVLKRTCLTIEEIQEYFNKSNNSGTSETVCSMPFLSGQFKLHMNVSDETLNVSVLQVIDYTTPKDESVHADKCIQASNALLISNFVEPSSNAASECSQPEAADPFPFLNKHSKIEPSSNMMTVTEVSDSAKMKNLNNIDMQYMDMSEIIHFPSKAVESHSNLNTVVENVFEKVSLGPKQSSPVCVSEMVDIPTANSVSHISVNFGIAEKQVESNDTSNSDIEEPLKKLQECVSKEHETRPKKQSRLSLKQKSIQKTSQESDLDISVADKHLSNLEHQFAQFKTPEVSSCTEKAGLSSRNFKKESLLGDVPSTVNSTISEDASEMNASEIMEEIDDLSEKIKSLEEKIKQYDGDDELNKTEASLHVSDSEDSTDLFPQSVPPTPPNHI